MSYYNNKNGRTGSYGKNDNYNPSRKVDSRASGNSGVGHSQVAGTSQFPNIEIIEDRLYWVSGPRPPTSYTDAYFFSVDQELVYDPFNNDFGPLNLALMHKYVRELVRLLADP